LSKQCCWLLLLSLALTIYSVFLVLILEFYIYILEKHTSEMTKYTNTLFHFLYIPRYTCQIALYPFPSVFLMHYKQEHEWIYAKKNK
jgi:hypothetical protein